ncbi:MAG: lipid-binding SYLF domain-containing protein [Desulfocapsaceae bacterium]|jgi:lipid-binding SYLF domain-containing protein|nr:lipid-binding SYLF domain-containing protein [Desulfocapsaceae bacterium]
MRIVLRSALIVFLFAFLCSPSYADEYSETKEMFANAGAANLFDSAYGYALFPTIGKAGFIVGGAYGKGRVYEQGNYVGDTSMTQASIGFQIGGAGFSQVVFFEDKRALDTFTTGNFEFGAEAQAVAITAAAGATSNTAGSSATASGGKNNAVTTDAGYTKGMLIFTIVKGGAMFDVSVGGQKFKYMKM